MRTVTGFVCAVLLVVCGLGLEAQEKKQSKPDRSAKPVTVTGCLSAGQQNGILLTAQNDALDSGVATEMNGAAPTVTYQLFGGDQRQLQQMIGQRVLVKGKTDAKPRANVKSQSKEEGAATGSSGRKPAPKVETTEKTNIEVRKLQVSSVQPAPGGAPCPTSR